MNLSADVAACLQRHHLQSSAGVVAVSGGPDSVALAHLLAGLLREGKIERLILAHVNHQLRGEESDADENHVQQLPQLFGMAADARLSCKTTRIDVAAIAQAERENLESIARRERYGWLTQLSRDEGATWIAAGHSADDQAETVLFRLLRGSGVLGLAGMAECRPLGDHARLLRPLLAVRRDAIRAYLHTNKIPYRIDSSNNDPRFARNRIRLELMPQLQEHFNPAVVDGLCQLAEQARELHGEIEAQAGRLLAQAELPRAGDMLVFSVDPLQKCSANRMREMFRLVWQREAWPMGDMDFERWNRLVEIVTGSGSAWDFPGRIHARRLGTVMQIWRKASGRNNDTNPKR